MHISYGKSLSDHERSKRIPGMLSFPVSPLPLLYPIGTSNSPFVYELQEGFGLKLPSGYPSQ